MTLTAKTMEWLNQNRHRSYPMQRNAWRDKASPESGLDCVLLDALVFDADSSGHETFELVSVKVESSKTIVTIRYNGSEFAENIPAGTVSGEGSFYFRRRFLPSSGRRHAVASLVFSSHSYIKEVMGEGLWDVECPLLPARVVSLTDGIGVDRIVANGSYGVEGHEGRRDVDGDVVLEDGYRTSPVISNGRVLVRVGKRYGLDPCTYDFGDAGDRDCRRPLFYFCGQNAVNSGNIVIKGGKGVNVTQGGEYVVHDRNSKCNGKSIPCIEIAAGRELLDMYKPTASMSQQGYSNV